MSDDERALLLRLVRHIDNEHESDTGYCHPQVPDDCSPYCRACRTLRFVGDDTLRAARAPVPVGPTKEGN